MADVDISLSLDERRALNALTNLIKKQKEVGTSAQKNFGKATSAFDVFKGALAADIVVKGLEGIASAFVSVGSAAFDLGKSFIDNASQIEDIQVKFEVLTGSATEAAAVMKDLTTFTATTPFQLEGVAAAAKNLLAFGLESEKLLPTLRQLGDVAAGSGKDFTELATIFGQIRLEGKLTGERLNQLQDAGIPIGPVLKKSLDTGGKSIKDFVAAGKVGFADVEAAFKSLTSEGGLFFQATIRQSKTLSGVISTLKDAFALAGADIGKAFLPTIKETAIALIDLINENRELIASFANAAAASFTEVLRGLSVVVKGTTEAFKDFDDEIDTLVLTFKLASAAIAGYVLATNGAAIAAGAAAIATKGFALAVALVSSPITLVVAGAAALAVGIKALANNFDFVVGNIKIFAAEILNTVIPALELMLKGSAFVVSIFNEDLAAAIEGRVQSLRELSDELKASGNAQIESAQKTTDAVKQLEQEQRDEFKKTSDAKKASTQEQVDAERDKKDALQEIKEEGKAQEEEDKLAKKEEEEIEDQEKKERLQKNLADEQQCRDMAAADRKAKNKKNIKDIDKDNKKAKDDRKSDLADIFSFEKNTSKSQLANLKATLGTIATLQSESNTKLFNIGKAAAIATATIDGIAAVQKALGSAPPPFNFALAAIVGVATAANIERISQTQPPAKRQEGGFVPGPNAQVDNQTIQAASGELLINRRQQTDLFNAIQTGNLGGGGVTNVTIEGNVMADDESQVDRLIDRINDQIEFRNATLAV